MTRDRLTGLTAIGITSVLWGTTGTAATFAPEVGPLAIGAAALGVGGLLQAAVALPALRAAAPSLRAQARTVALGALAVALYPLAFYSSMHLAGVAVGTVVSLASAPLASGLLERLTDRRPLGPWWALAALLGVAGGVMLCIARLQDSPTGGAGAVPGIGLGLVAGLTYATYSWVVRRLMARGIGRAASMGAVFGPGGLLLVPVLLLTGTPLLASGRALGVTAYMALVPMFLGYLLFGLGLARVPASTATTITLAEPAVAAALAVLVVGERLGGLGWLGLALVGVALSVLALSPGADPDHSGALLEPTLGPAGPAPTATGTPG